MGVGKRPLTIAGASLLLAAAVIPFLIRFGAPLEDSGLREDILELRGLDEALTSNVLQLRLGLESNYDSLVTRGKQIQDREAEFLRRSSSLGEPASSRLRDAFAPFRIAAAERERILEAFPVDNATLNNSLRLLGATYQRALTHFEEDLQPQSEIARRLGALYDRALQYAVDPDEDSRQTLLHALDEEWTIDGSSTGSVRAMLGHVRILVTQKARVDAHIRRLVSLDGERSLLQTFAVFEEEARASAQHTARLRSCVYVTCLLVVILTCAAGAWAAMRRNTALEREVRERIRADQEARKLETELRQAQKLESIGQLAAGIAHEINTPVQFVSDSVHFARDAVKDVTALLAEYQGLYGATAPGPTSAASLAAVTALAEETDVEYLLANLPKALDRSLEGLDRVTTIVRSLKDFAHPETGEKAPADINQGIQSTLTIARNEYKYVAELETDFGTLPAVACFLGSVNQAVLNIVVNAAHAIGDVVNGTDAKGRIVVRTRVDGDFVVISISDTGGGIPEGIRERIFDPFFTTKEVGKGTGQGLAIARSVVVEKHGGELTFETVMGKGTTFLLRLPIAGSRPEALATARP